MDRVGTRSFLPARCARRASVKAEIELRGGEFLPGARRHEISAPGPMAHLGIAEDLAATARRRRIQVPRATSVFADIFRRESVRLETVAVHKAAMAGEMLHDHEQRE